MLADLRDRLYGHSLRALAPQGRQPTIAIIGAGFGGLCTGARLSRLGYENFTIYEKSDGVGGTWHDNSYPGATCDVPSHLYSLSFELYPEWSRLFPPRDEIQTYQHLLVERYGLGPHLRLNTTIESLVYDDNSSTWTLRLVGGDGGAEHVTEEVRADIVVSGLGQLNIPAYPDIAGIEDFAGEQFHSARWNHDIDLTGRSVAVIGTGASAVQFVPPVAEQVAHLSLFQRSANWVMPKPDRPFADHERTRFRDHPALMRAYRARIYLEFESRWPLFLGKPGFLPATVKKMGIAHLKEHIADRDLRAKLIPDYPPGCKRLLISNDFYPALARDNVDVITDTIAEVDADGVRTVDGTHHPADVIIYGTGFETTNFLAGLEVKGIDGTSLHEVWQDGADAYLGMAVAGFPNLFLLYGPNTNLGHNSILFMIEAQVHQILSLMRAKARRGAAVVEVRREAQAEFARDVEKKAGKTVWAEGCHSWYKTASGRITNNWTSWTLAYWWRTRRANVEAFDFRN
jgi:cation diffusion facilitator CzcD-associated flavoprotein CzcO